MQLTLPKRRAASLLHCALIARTLALVAGCDGSASAVVKLPTPPFPLLQKLRKHVACSPEA